MNPLILASQSPFRRQILTNLGLDFKAVAASIDEREKQSGFQGPIEEVPEFLAKEKALSIRDQFPNHIVIGSDQLLLFRGQALHKPLTRDQAIERLQLLQGQTHQLYTGLALLGPNQSYTTTVIATMTMHPLTDSEIMQYVELDEPMGCAGGYKVEQRGPLLFEKIKCEDHNAIIGLPTLKLLSKLRAWNYPVLGEPSQ